MPGETKSLTATFRRIRIFFFIRKWDRHGRGQPKRGYFTPSLLITPLGKNNMGPWADASATEALSQLFTPLIRSYSYETPCNLDRFQDVKTRTCIIPREQVSNKRGTSNFHVLRSAREEHWCGVCEPVRPCHGAIVTISAATWISCHCKRRMLDNAVRGHEVRAYLSIHRTLPI